MQRLQRSFLKKKKQTQETKERKKEEEKSKHFVPSPTKILQHRASKMPRRDIATSEKWGA